MRKIPQQIQLIGLQHPAVMKLIISTSRDIAKDISPANWISVAKIFQF